MKTRLIGDIHGQFRDYIQFDIQGSEHSIQVGDFGCGFGYKEPFEAMTRYGEHKFIRGNHDNPDACAASEHWIPDGSIHRGFYCIGGAGSIDRDQRLAGKDWWPDEELSFQRFFEIAEDWAELKPDFVVSHDCPDSVADHLFPWKLTGPRYDFRTPKGLQMLWDIHKPKLHVFGHWHFFRDVTIFGTRFICLPEHHWIDVEICSSESATSSSLSSGLSYHIVDSSLSITT